MLNDQSVSPPQDRVNIVFMGMGEPFLNYDNFIKAVDLLVRRRGHSGIPYDGFNRGNRAADIRSRRRNRCGRSWQYR